MNAHVSLIPGSRVTVVDDDEDGRDELMDVLRDFKFEPHAVVGMYDHRVADLVAAVEAQNPDFVICDNRLQPRQMAQFFGSEVVRELVARRRPAMLLTMYGSSDRFELRRSRYDVPVVVQRDVFRLELLSEYYEICQREIAHNPIDERKPHRVLIRIDSISKEQPQYVDAIISSWRPEHAVPIPIECISKNIRNRIESGTYLIGDVNIGAKMEEDLYFHNLDEFAPAPKGGLD